MEKTLVKPFKATYYNPRFFKDYSSLVCPPYDLLDSEKIEFFRKVSPYNFSHILIRGDKSYKELVDKYHKWLKEEIIIDDKSEAMYLYEQNFNYEGKKYSRLGLFCLLRLDNCRAILPHEYTYHRPKIDRAKMMDLFKANICSIFVIASGRNRKLSDLLRNYRSRRRPFIKFDDFEGINNRLWKITSLDIIKEIQRILDKKHIVIADGHHRFEVAYEYYLKNKGKFKDINYILAYITFEDKGLIIMPTHRLTRTFVSLDVILKKLEKDFFIHKVERDELIKKINDTRCFSFGIINKNISFFLTMKDPNLLERIFTKTEDKVYKNLDVFVFHKFVLKKIGMDKNRFSYTHEIDPIDVNDKNKIMFVLRKPKLKEVFRLAKAGYRMPQKSTYFYPKIVSGLLLRRFEPL